jgi:hypothetical protein
MRRTLAVIAGLLVAAIASCALLETPPPSPRLTHEEIVTTAAGEHWLIIVLPECSHGDCIPSTARDTETGRWTVAVPIGD